MRKTFITILPLCAFLVLTTSPVKAKEPSSGFTISGDSCGGPMTITRPADFKDKNGHMIYVRWQTSCTGTLIGDDDASKTVNTPGTHTFYVRPYNSILGLWGGCMEDSLTIHELPTAPPTPARYSNTLIMESNAPAGETYYWQGTVCGTDKTYPTSDNYVVTAETMYYVRTLSDDGCWSDCSSINIKNLQKFDVSTETCGPKTITRPEDIKTKDYDIHYFWQKTCGGESTKDKAASKQVNEDDTYYIKTLYDDGKTTVWLDECLTEYVDINEIPDTLPEIIYDPINENLYYEEQPPAGISYFWQGTSCGTNVMWGDSSIAIHMNDTYYIRARSDAHCWGESCDSIDVTMMVGVQEVPSLPISVNPNPATELITVTGLDKKAKIGLVNLNGIEVLSVDVASTEHDIDISGLPGGIYLLRVKQGGDVYNVEVLIE